MSINPYFSRVDVCSLQGQSLVCSDRWLLSSKSHRNEQQNSSKRATVLGACISAVSNHTFESAIHFLPSN